MLPDNAKDTRKLDMHFGLRGTQISQDFKYRVSVYVCVVDTRYRRNQQEYINYLKIFYLQH